MRADHARAIGYGRLMRAFIVTFALPLVSSACVSGGAYDDLLMAHERAKRDVVEAQLVRDREVHERKARETELAALQADKAQLERAAAQHKDEHAATTAQLAKAQKDLAHASDELASTIRDRAGLKESLTELQAALADVNKRKAEADRRLAEFKRLLERFSALIDAGKLKVKIVDGRMVVALTSDVLFAPGNATLSPEGKAAIVEVAGLLASMPERAFQVEGHTDNVPIKNAQFPSNWELASARAITVVKTMVDAGMPAARVSAASFGEQKSAATNDTPEGRAQNRRIEIVVVPDLSTLPGFDELKAASN